MTEEGISGGYKKTSRKIIQKCPALYFTTYFCVTSDYFDRLTHQYYVTDLTLQPTNSSLSPPHHHHPCFWRAIYSLLFPCERYCFGRVLFFLYYFRFFPRQVAPTFTFSCIMSDKLKAMVRNRVERKWNHVLGVIKKLIGYAVDKMP